MNRQKFSRQQTKLKSLERQSNQTYDINLQESSERQSQTSKMESRSQSMPVLAQPNNGQGSIKNQSGMSNLGNINEENVHV